MHLRSSPIQWRALSGLLMFICIASQGCEDLPWATMARAFGPEDFVTRIKRLHSRCAEPFTLNTYFLSGHFNNVTHFGIIHPWFSVGVFYTVANDGTHTRAKTEPCRCQAI